jgi:hypothetical protein
MKRRTEITIETDRLVVVARAGRHFNSLTWCASCGLNIQMMTTDDAALAARVNSRTIFHLVESGRLHSVETAEGLLLVCPHSLAANF